MSHVKRFLSSHQAAAAVEGALAASFLVVALAGLFEIVNTLYAGDLIKRAAYRVARANALHDTAATSQTVLQKQCMNALTAEFGDMFDFKTATDPACTDPNHSDPPDFCLTFTVDVYDDPVDMLSNTKSQGSNALLGGDAKDMVVVRVHVEPKGLLGRMQGLWDETGIQTLAVARNERMEETS